MNKTKPKQVFFHVGLGKTGSIYLQFRVFPKLRGIKYIPRLKYRDFKYARIIEKSSYEKFLVSTGFDRQLEREAHKIASKYPNARILIVLRRHDSWIASQYRRFVKNGYPKMFEDFIDMERDQGDWKQKDLYFYPKLVMLEKLFGNRPLVLFHDELVTDPHSFIGKICAFIGADYDKDSINLNRKHTSYNEKQLKVRRILSARIKRRMAITSSKYWVRRTQIFLRMPERYLSLYLGYLTPSRWLPKESLVSKESLLKVRVHYEEDWKKCQAYAKETDWILSSQ